MHLFDTNARMLTRLSMGLFALCSTVLLLGMRTAMAVSSGVITMKTVQVMSPGPPVWIAKFGSDTVYVVGSISPLPATLAWPQRNIAALISGASKVIMPARLELYKSVSIIEEAKLDWLQHYRWPKNPRGSTLKSRLDKKTYSTWRRTWAKFDPHSEPPDRLRPYFAYKEVLRKYEAHFDLRTKMFQRQVSHIARRYGIPVAKPVLVWNVADPELTWKGLSRMSPHCFAASLATLQQSTFARLYWRAKAWSVGYMPGLKRLGYSSGLFACNWNSQVLAQAGMPDDYLKLAGQWWAQYVAAAARKYHVIVVIERVSTLENRGISDLIKLGAVVISPDLTSPGSATALQTGAGAPVRSARLSFQSPRAVDRTADWLPISSSCPG
jgi:hypothetical protein